MPIKSLLCVGAGRMGGAILHGAIQKKTVDKGDITIIDPHLDDPVLHQCCYLDEMSQLADGYQPDVILFAVKPQMIADVIGPYTCFDLKKTVFVSVLAGTPVDFFEERLGDQAAIVRTMPNLPAAIGEGAVGAFANENVDIKRFRQAKQLLSSVGHVSWLESESQIDDVTALSGSGPAYVFYFLECMVKEAEGMGLAPEIAFELARHTFGGAAKMMLQKEVKQVQDVVDLRQRVTSPGGTTAAALEQFMQDGALEELSAKAMRAAKSRAIELSGK